MIQRSIVSDSVRQGRQFSDLDLTCCLMIGTCQRSQIIGIATYRKKHTIDQNEAWPRLELYI